ncbi:hypothetical protein GCM10008955_24920 [Deinococcus malanensis]|uniref:Uncharacterized protein n=1 Tax=Deinococcus malanensis TaxID=1706855 RepID=A0ABQ2EZZ5_9DEIO|nr:hypothetical protein GCM10008955_24920 [Deinococcus malanensis]
MVVVCGVKNNDCDQDNVKSVQLQQGGTEATFRVDGLKPGSYYLLGWKDLNSSHEIDAGDYVGVYSSDGGTSATVISGATNNANVTLAQMAAPDGNAVSGTVQVPAGSAVTDVVVFTCVPGAQVGCDPDKMVASGVTADGKYLLENVPAGPFHVMAWLDVNGDRQPNAGDLYGTFRDTGGALAQVQAPRQNVDLRLDNFPTAAPSTPAPAQLGGTWISGTSTGVDYYNPGSGQWAPPSGTGVLLQIHPDGTFTRGVTVQLSNYGCTTTVIGHYTGRVRVSGSEMVLEPTSSRQKYLSSCNSSLNYDREVPNVSLPFTWELGSDGRLVLTWPSGGKTYFNRT